MRQFIRRLIVALILIMFIEAQANKLFGLYAANEFDVPSVTLQDHSRSIKLNDKTNRNLSKEVDPRLIKDMIKSYISNRNLNSLGLSWVEPGQFSNRVIERANKYALAELNGFTPNNSVRSSRGSDADELGSGAQFQRHRHYHNHRHYQHPSGDVSSIDPREVNTNWFNWNRCSPIGNVRRIGTSGYKFPCLNKSWGQQQQQPQQHEKITERPAAAQRLIRSSVYLRILAHIERFADQISDLAVQMRRSHPMAKTEVSFNKRDIDNDYHCCN